MRLVQLFSMQWSLFIAIMMAWRRPQNYFFSKCQLAYLLSPGTTNVSVFLLLPYTLHQWVFNRFYTHNQSYLYWQQHVLPISPNNIDISILMWKGSFSSLPWLRSCCPFVLLRKHARLMAYHRIIYKYVIP